MEIVHLRRDCASCSQNLGRNESPEFLPSPFNYPSSSICPHPLSDQVQTPPQFESLLLIFHSFSFIPILFSHGPTPNLTHPLTPSYCQYTCSSRWNLCPLDSVRTKAAVFCSFLATSQVAPVVKKKKKKKHLPTQETLEMWV